ncbi:hypothetical protein Sjap_024133 [Stephania japonica]|uniref:Uncharacterized protein n=1 Tax=Stephania japonica TaxID=461633 RepID=A0AAP0ECW2_9MAGN
MQPIKCGNETQRNQREQINMITRRNQYIKESLGYRFHLSLIKMPKLLIMNAR